MTLRRTHVAAAVLALGATACGSTVAGVTATGTAPVPGTGSGLSAPSASPGVLAPDGTVVGGPTSTAGSSSYVPGTTTVTGGPDSGNGDGTSTVPVTGGSDSGGGTVQIAGPGITADKIYYGVPYSSQSAAADRAIGASGAAPSYDARDVWNAAVAYANDHGGFAGRDLEPVFYDYDVSAPRSTEDQAACSKWTEDNKVFALEAFFSDILRACAEKAGAVSIFGGDGVRSTYAKYPHYVDPFSIRLDRLGPVTVAGLYQAGYFAGRLGLVTWDDQNYRYAMEHGYLPELAKHGIKPALDPVYIAVPQQVGAIGDMTAAISSAVTKFKAAGIDHVIIQDGAAGIFGGAGLTLEWMNQAESQRYRPRYGQNQENAPGWEVLPANQMDRAVAIMTTDTDKRYDEGWHVNDTREKCFKIMADAGLPVSGSNQNDEGIAAQTCDQVFFTQQVINSLSVISNDTFMQAVEGLGTSFPSAVVYGTKFMPGRHDGADRVRKAEYFKSCKCLKYSGPPYYPD